MNDVDRGSEGGALESGRGLLEVHVDSPSVFFGASVLIEIRDSGMGLVERVTSPAALKLSPGLYEVSAVLEDGRDHRRIAEVTEGERTEVAICLETGGGLVPGDALAPAPPSELATRSSIFFGGDQRIRHTRSALAVEVELLEVEGVEVVESTETLWTLKAPEEPAAVPAATLRLGGRTVRLSLPTSPGNPCVIRVEPRPSGPAASAWIAPQRTVANALQNMVGEGQLGHAAHMAEEATMLLRDKYADPTGAALGALILHRAGRLAERRAWLENLARDFAWLPDGKILLVSELVASREEEEMELARDLAFAASEQRILFTEAFSILVGLLRRWPNLDGRAELQEPLLNLVGRCADTDWSSIFLAQT